MLIGAHRFNYEVGACSKVHLAQPVKQQCQYSCQGQKPDHPWMAHSEFRGKINRFCETACLQTRRFLPEQQPPIPISKRLKNSAVRALPFQCFLFSLPKVFPLLPGRAASILYLPEQNPSRLYRKQSKSAKPSTSILSFQSQRTNILESSKLYFNIRTINLPLLCILEK